MPDRIKEVRLETINALLTSAYLLVNNATQENQCTAHLSLPRQSSSPLHPSSPSMEEIERSQCTATNYHSMQRALTQLNYWPPISHPSHVHASVLEVAEELSSIDVLKLRTLKDPDAHRECNAGVQLAARVKEVLEQMREPAAEEALARLARNRGELMMAGVLDEE